MSVMPKSIRKILLLAVGVCVCSVALSAEPTTANSLLFDPRPWCIGRLLFDRPTASEIANQRYEFRGDKLDTQYDVSLVTYRAKIDARERELRTKKRIDLGNENREMDHSWLEKSFSPVKNSQVLVYRGIEAGGIPMLFDSDGYVYGNNTLFHMTGRIGSTAIDRAEEIYGNTVSRIKQRDNWTVPTESGFCFDGGIVTGSSTYTEEVSQSFMLMPGRPALLVIQMRESVEPDQKETLAKTLPELRAQVNRLPGHYRILRKGKRTIAEMNAEEVLFQVREGDIISYQFYLLAPGDPSTLAKPHTSIQLLLGTTSFNPNLTPDLATSPVDEAGALQVWDTLLNSLRLRPGAV
jgi:hypothetical protein